MSGKATPRPWVVNRGEHAYIKNPLYKGIIADLGCAPGDDPLYVCNPDDRKSGPEQWLPNAELIVRAVNNHDALVAAAKALVLEYLSHGGDGTHRNCDPGCRCFVPTMVEALAVIVERMDGEPRADWFKAPVDKTVVTA